MNINDQDMMSEESEDEGGGESREEMIYRRKYQMLLERCEVLQQVNYKFLNTYCDSSNVVKFSLQNII